MGNNPQKPNRVFSTQFKKEKVILIEQGKLTVNQVHKMYDVSQTSVYRWITKYGKLPKEERMVVEKVSEELKTLELLQKVAKLEQCIGKLHIENLYKDTIIELGSELVGEDLKKKFDTQQSKK
jgi:transposase